MKENSSHKGYKTKVMHFQGGNVFRVFSTETVKVQLHFKDLGFYTVKLYYYPLTCCFKQ